MERKPGYQEIVLGMENLTLHSSGLRRGVGFALKGHKVESVEKSWLVYNKEHDGATTHQEIRYRIDGQDVNNLNPSTIIRALGLPTYTSEEVAEKTGLSLSQVHKFGSRYQRGMKLSGGIAWTEEDIALMEKRKGERGRPAKR